MSLETSISIIKLDKIIFKVMVKTFFDLERRKN